ncbi:phosphotransferase [Paenibacillus lycopersici]|uniref:Phosphotransferase n=1 Tax=Paenibacillus lycopersici TaxID=2704462 RepID=A0A6C0G0M0_9BACL|nr:phosphotransferase [Paenibacillus lycopersici]
MEVKHRIEDSILTTHLEHEYGIPIERIRFIPMGDSAYSYRVDCANGERRYLKLFDSANGRQLRSIERLRQYLPATWHMHHRGLFRYLTYPFPNRNGQFATRFHGITAVLFNFIDGETLADAYPFSEAIVARIAAAAAAIHRLAPLIDKTSLVSETYDLSFETELKTCLTALETTAVFANPILSDLQASLLPKLAQIRGLMTLLHRLRDAAVADPKAHVLCHGDMWGGNLIRNDNDLYVVDWESMLLAPPEFDFIGYMGEEFGVFLTAYERQLGRAVTVNPDLLRFYAYRHHLRNLTNWLMNLLYRNTEDAQNANDLEMILHHCMDRWDSVEFKVGAVEELLRHR